MKITYLGLSGGISEVRGLIDTKRKAANKECDLMLGVGGGDESVTLQGNPGKTIEHNTSEFSLPEGEGTRVYSHTSFC